MSQSTDKLTLGKISGVFGVRGWVKVFSRTSPAKGILKYHPWLLKQQGEWKKYNVINGRQQGKSIVAQLEGVDDRDRAYSLIGTEIAIKTDQLPKLQSGEYYWADLEGMTVMTKNAENLGKVGWLFETGSNDVLVVEGEKERLIPWIMDEVIISIDREESTIIVDWDPEF